MTKKLNKKYTISLLVNIINYYYEIFDLNEIYMIC